jgi:hypothetical protein
LESITDGQLNRALKLVALGILILVFLYVFGTVLMLFRLVFAPYMSQGFALWGTLAEVLAIAAVFFGLWKTR